MTESAHTISCNGDQLLAILHGVDYRECDIGVVFVVGGPQYRVGSHRQYVQMARRLASANYPVVRFDLRGMGDSEGPSASFEHIDEDIKSAIDLLIATQVFVRRIVVFGLCDAASAAMMYCSQDERVCGIILANPWVRTPEGESRELLRGYYLQRFRQRTFWSKLLSGKVGLFSSISDLVRRAFTLLVGSKSGPPTPNREFFVERMLRGFARFSGASLILISENDLTGSEFVSLCKLSTDWAKSISRTSVKIHTLHGADHTYSSSEAMQSASEQMIQWLNTLQSGRSRQSTGLD